MIFNEKYNTHTPAPAHKPRPHSKPAKIWARDTQTFRRALLLSSLLFFFIYLFDTRGDVVNGVLRKSRFIVRIQLMGGWMVRAVYQTKEKLWILLPFARSKQYERRFKTFHFKIHCSFKCTMFLCPFPGGRACGSHKSARTLAEVEWCI